MTHNEFFYWLQGHFEMANYDVNAPATLTSNQVDCAFRHASLVPPGADERRFLMVCALLTLMSEKVVPLDGGTAKLKQLIHDQFEQVIDSQAGPAENQNRMAWYTDGMPTKAIIKTHD